MLGYIDNYLNKITMYRLVLYYLVGLLGIAFIISFFHKVPYSPAAILFSTAFILTICWATNNIFAKIFKVHTNIESIYITAFILALIISPLQSLHDTAFFTLATWASLWAMASKYLIAINKKHIFNPAAFAVALTALTLGVSASWWVGTLWLLPFVLIGGLLITRKIQRFDMVLSFLVVAFISALIAHYSGSSSLITTTEKVLVETPLLFFAFVMLTEPLTTPPTRMSRIAYAVFVGLIFSPTIHIGSIYSTPELALVVGNIFSYMLSPKEKFVLKLREKKQVAEGVYDFWFDIVGKSGTSVEKNGKRAFNFKPGQYLEWTLASRGGDNDSRGNRRYFTISSSPTESGVAMGVKFYNTPSTFKKSLMLMEAGDTIMAGQRAGDFVLPNDTSKKLVFMAGGIGVTPFRSMIKYLTDKGESRTITLFYSNKHAQDIAYKEVFNDAEKRLGMKIIYSVTDTEGFITEAKIRQEVPDFAQRMFYLSGPRSMVVAFDTTLRNMGVKDSQIKKDFFPGFA